MLVNGETDWYWAPWHRQSWIFITLNVPQPLYCALFWCALIRLSSWYSLASFAGAPPPPIIHSLHGKVSPTSPQEAQTTVVHNPADGTKVSCFYSSLKPPATTTNTRGGFSLIFLHTPPLKWLYTSCFRWYTAYVRTQEYNLWIFSFFFYYFQSASLEMV